MPAPFADYLAIGETEPAHTNRWPERARARRGLEPAA